MMARSSVRSAAMFRAPARSSAATTALRYSHGPAAAVNASSAAAAAGFRTAST
jgi:hypothetical protein